MTCTSRSRDGVLSATRRWLAGGGEVKAANVVLDVVGNPTPFGPAGALDTRVKRQVLGTKNGVGNAGLVKVEVELSTVRERPSVIKGEIFIQEWKRRRNDGVIRDCVIIKYKKVRLVSLRTAGWSGSRSG